MALVTPEDIAKAAERAYPQLLAAWIEGREPDFFPHVVRRRFTPDAKDVRGTIRAVEALLAKSKDQRGWGYTVALKERRTRDFGRNRFPETICIPTRDDLLRLAKREKEFQATCHAAQRVRASLPQLEGWLRKHVRTLAKLAGPIEGLVRVAQYFIDHPWPDCYARQIPVAVDTKFIQRHQATLRPWLEELLPASAIDFNEKTFARRFGLRDRQPHRAVRLLDVQLQAELGLPFDELSLPLRLLAELPVRNATVVIVENRLNLLTLPGMRRGVAIRGEGADVNRLERLPWLHENRIVYWGDLDVEGLAILSRLRNVFCNVRSVMMDRDTLIAHQRFAIKVKATRTPKPTNLTPQEAAAFQYCCERNFRLEQEKIPQSYVDQTFATFDCN